MAKYAWATDVHLEFLGDTDDRVVKFARSIVEQSPTGVFLTGDISIAPRLIYHLSVLERELQRPIYFVLGNHDYYRSDIETVRKQMRELSNFSQYLKYLPTTPYAVLSPSTAVVGHDGWYDALNGDWQNSGFTMTDWSQIHEFVPYGGRSSQKFNIDKASIVTLCRKLAHEGVTHVAAGIKAAVRYHKNVVVLTHFPPFAEAHVYQGKIGDSWAQPWFTSKMMGDMLLDAARTYPNTSFTILAGHTHGRVTVQAAPNMVVHVGDAEYNRPKLQSMIELP